MDTLEKMGSDPDDEIKQRDGFGHTVLRKAMLKTIERINGYIKALPEDVKRAFKESTQVERMLYSRARYSKISYRFCEIPGHPLEGTDPMTSQKCVRGNIGIHPQDATHLNDVLPPCYEVIRDSVCAVFVGKTKPDAKTIEGLRPALVRKSRVLAVIGFLTDRGTG